MATIDRNGPRYRIRTFEGGKRIVAGYAKTKTEAVAMRAKIEDMSFQVKRKSGAGQLDLVVLVGLWSKAKLAGGCDEYSTRTRVGVLLQNIRKAGWTKTYEVTAKAVSRFRETGASPRACGYLGGLLRWAALIHDQHIDEGALVALRPGPGKRRPRSPLLTDAQAEDIQARADQIGPHAGALIHYLATYGARPISAARLLVGDVDAKRGMLTVRVKGGDILEHPLLPETLERLTAVIGQRGAGDALFQDPRTDKPFAIASDVGVPQFVLNHLRIKVYDLKRYAISTMLARGMPAADVALFTGHRDLPSVMRYARTNQERAQAALRVMGCRPIIGHLTQSG